MATAANTYLKLISQDEKKAQQGQLKIEAQTAFIGVQNEVMKLKTSIFGLESALEKAKRAIPYNLQNEFKVAQNLKAENERLAFSMAILEERFSDATI